MVWSLTITTLTLTTIPTLIISQAYATATVMSNLSTQEIEKLQGFLDEKLLQLISDERTPTSNCVSSPFLPEFTEKELDELFNTTFEQHENKCNSNTSTSTTAKQLSEVPTRNFAKPVSSKEVDEAILGYRRIAYIVNGVGFWDEKIISFRDRNSTKESWTNYIWRWGNSLEEKDFRWQYSTVCIRYNAVHEWALFCSTWRKRTQKSTTQTIIHSSNRETWWKTLCWRCVKNDPGGLKGRKIKPKIVYHHANNERPERWFIRLYKLYNSWCPADRPDHAYYLKPLQKPKNEFWHSNQPVGHYKLDATISRMCKDAGMPGHHTNHSLRASAATRLHQFGCVEEQKIMERTGHRNSEAVRSYKRSSNEQLQQLSDILNNGTT